MPDVWIQLENKRWDVAPTPGPRTPPQGIDRMTGRTMQEITQNPPISVTLTSPETGATSQRTMFFPLRDISGNLIDALILRRYRPPARADQSDAWTVPDDRKVNPWDLNEPDPTDSGTQGTIPGPVIEATLPETVTLHFRNKDLRADGAGLLSIKTRTHSLHTHGFAYDPRFDGAYPLSPPDTIQAVGSEAPLWAPLGFAATDNKKGDRVPPLGTFTYTWQTVGWPTTAGVWLYHDHSIFDMENVMLGAIGIVVIHNPQDPDDVSAQTLPGGSPNGSPVDPATNRYRVPTDALYLQLFHEMTGAEMLINGRKYMGNTPTLVGGPTTKMRFGLVAMNQTMFHTFHLHGHRWVIPGPSGNHPGGGNGPNPIQNSPLVQAVSQFEDTKIFGPANSFSFTIREGTFMGAVVPFGEWHMHCHVLSHMESDRVGGMMGSLLIVNSGDQSVPLPVGDVPALTPMGVDIGNNFFQPPAITIPVGTTLRWTNRGSDHTVTSDRQGTIQPCGPPFSNERFDSADKYPNGIIPTSQFFEHTFNSLGTFPYHCEVHGCTMSGIVTVTLPTPPPPPLGTMSVNVRLASRSGTRRTIQVTVTDSTTQSAIQGAAVTVLDVDGNEQAAGTTNSQGIVTLTYTRCVEPGEPGRPPVRPRPVPCDGAVSKQGYQDAAFSAPI